MITNLDIKNNYFKIIEDHSLKYMEEKKDFYIEFYTVEKYSVGKLTVLKQYLQDILITNTMYKDSFESIENQINIISHILNTPNSIEMRFIPTAFDITLQRIVPYGRLHHNPNDSDIPCGRLYPLIPSMVQLSRQIRRFLFSDKYFDIDLVNAHPTILASYAIENELNVPSLTDYVENRESILKEIVINSGCSREDAKKLILIAQNTTSIQTKSLFVTNYSQEIVKIRQHMWENQKNLVNYLNKRESFKGKSIDEQMITLQSYYCFNTESSLLLDLRQYLFNMLHLDNRPSFNTSKRFLHFIPFFMMVTKFAERGFSIAMVKVAQTSRVG